ncbi:MAG TPA: putative toxin-antitoxin system toxin component, PIN family [Puia sp.]|jgi:putative PIN family toxin of toxin-antitoxin system|nr:putative toxin-antitoxin system toxin component, PIN family [Puia sp.]
MRVVLDTNIILSSVSRYSPYKIIMDKLEEGAYDICVTTEVLLEYEEKLTENFSYTLANLVIGALLLKSNVVKTEIYYRWNLIASDADDNKFADCALAANANFLVTNDRDYNVLKKINFPSIEVVNIDEFVSMLHSI